MKTTEIKIVAQMFGDRRTLAITTQKEHDTPGKHTISESEIVLNERDEDSPLRSTCSVQVVINGDFEDSDMNIKDLIGDIQSLIHKRNICSK